ncbi:hypothetical protein IQ235_01065 [Oscillatoriales cyanobacterium LEGE 11467]|uniref:Uncharacterized protein n=1 Tax=Zarconia navalis LEGE 11467 TaxID=1828826 RepID=A0A928Z824_9CYAN|nr:hypothetical protein [Zarconia navalis]MBE9039386.1 hypothetical protein [Zarconia navalis LEGE 11467]
MQTVQAICCPNCGSIAKRFYSVNAKRINADCPKNLVTRTECPTCDYLMVTCSMDGRVIEAYAPGIAIPRCDVRWKNWHDLPQVSPSSKTELNLDLI